jgi:hypothetical protein
MREARAAADLILRSDVVPHAHRGERDLMIFVNEHRQAVGKPVRLRVKGHG